MRRWGLFAAGWLLILAGSWLAGAVQTSGGITVTDVRFPGTGGVTMSGLLYTPRTATAEHPAPGVLAVHGYINSRETQSPFAIEFARRGYVVLALDQTGHGYSGGAAFANGFGGPDGLKYLRGLPMVDKANIGLEGHSMGGWTVLAAAAAMPDAYKAVVLEGSSTGAPFAAEGTPAWPRNLALVFSRYDEFSKLMWGVERARDLAGSAKLKTVFGTSADVVPGKVYGAIADGTARRLTQPVTTHPGDHLSPAAVGDAVDWFARTLTGGAPRPASDQIWMWKEIGTGIAFVGFVVLLLGTFNGLLGLPLFAALRHEPEAAVQWRSGRWWGGLLTMALLPVVTYFPVFIAVTVLLKPSPLLPQTITSQVVAWALVNAVLTLAVGWLMRRRNLASFDNRWGPAVLIAVATTSIGYLSLVAVDALFKVDFRFWVVALKLFSPAQAKIALVYVLPLTAFFLVATRALHGRLSVLGDGPVKAYASAVAAMALGFALLLVVDYGLFFLTGRLPTDLDPLSTVVAIQFLPLMAIVGVISTFTWRRTGSYVPGAVICGLFVTWYVVAGTATQVV
ncbi:MAG TPA: alpha/beta fold hydrolase [Caulobacter sp.]|nr:alpha/beta fold hydrolase [Caulobacter sp.]